MRHPHAHIDTTGAVQTSGHTHCTNCGAELQGMYCHVCGQSTRHILKHLPALTEDALDVVFNIDGRIMHTLPALYVRPGFLAREYFLGRRAHYISPFRLMFFLSVLAFLVIQFNLGLNHDLFAHTRIGPDSGIGLEKTPAAVHADLRKAIKPIQAARDRPGVPPAARAAMDMSIQALQEKANQRLRQLGAAPVTAVTPPPGKHSDRAATSGGKPGPADTPLQHPGTLEAAGARQTSDIAAALTSDKASAVHISWLPGFANDRINAGIDQARANLRAMKSGDGKTRNGAMRRFLTHILSVLPQTLVVLIPLFAVILKLTYIFKRRLYIEHLMVALYSHAFIFMSLLLWALIGLAKYALPVWADTPMGWMQSAIWVWVPLYLLLMQKRIYMQGWFLTAVKYCFVGLCYSVLLSFALAGAAMISLAT